APSRNDDGGTLNDIAQEACQGCRIELAGKRQRWALRHAKAKPVRRIDAILTGQAREDAAILKARRASVETVDEDNRERVFRPGDGVVQIAAMLAVHFRVTLEPAPERLWRCQHMPRRDNERATCRDRSAERESPSDPAHDSHT